jgi:hypothetical protein
MKCDVTNMQYYKIHKYFPLSVSGTHFCFVFNNFSLICMYKCIELCSMLYTCTTMIGINRNFISKSKDICHRLSFLCSVGEVTVVRLQDKAIRLTTLCQILFNFVILKSEFFYRDSA